MFELRSSLSVNEPTHPIDRDVNVSVRVGFEILVQPTWRFAVELHVAHQGGEGSTSEGNSGGVFGGEGGLRREARLIAVGRDVGLPADPDGVLFGEEGELMRVESDGAFGQNEVFPGRERDPLPEMLQRLGGAFFDEAIDEARRLPGELAELERDGGDGHLLQVGAQLRAIGSSRELEGEGAGDVAGGALRGERSTC